VLSQKPKIRGEDIDEIGSMASHAVLMSRRFLVDSSEISATSILIGQAATAMETRGQSDTQIQRFILNFLRAAAIMMKELFRERIARLLVFNT
jgi:hypothetical protein